MVGREEEEGGGWRKEGMEGQKSARSEAVFTESKLKTKTKSE